MVETSVEVKEGEETNKSILIFFVLTMRPLFCFGRRGPYKYEALAGRGQATRYSGVPRSYYDGRGTGGRIFRGRVYCFLAVMRS